MFLDFCRARRCAAHTFDQAQLKRTVPFTVVLPPAARVPREPSLRGGQLTARRRRPDGLEGFFEGLNLASLRP